MKISSTLKVTVVAVGMAVTGSLLAAAPSLKTEIAVGKLELPWDMAFLKDGTMFFTEK